MQAKIKILVGFFCALLAPMSAAFEHETGPDNGCPIYWPDRKVSFTLSGISDADKLAEYEASIQQAMESWNAVTCSDFQFELSGTADETQLGLDEVNSIVFAPQWIHDSSLKHFTTVTYYIPNGKIMDVDIELNSSNFEFTSSQSQTVIYDTESIVLRALGHALGLAENEEDAQSVMNPQLDQGQLKRALTQDEIDGICYIYPKEGKSPSCPEKGGGCRTSSTGTDVFWLLWFGFLWLWCRTESGRPTVDHLQKTKESASSR